MTRGVLACVAMVCGLGVGAVAAGPIHDAALKGDRELVSRLLGEGADMNEQNDAGETAIYLAALSGTAKLVDQLLVLGADATIRDKAGMTAVHAAARAGSAESVSLLVGDAKLTARLDLNDHENSLGVTPLMVAADNDRGNVVAHLVGLDADLEIEDREGLTALTHAGKKGYAQIVTILLRSGAQCQAIDADWFAACQARQGELGLAKTP